jgi:sugar lactone lactonase YvrE
MTLLRLRTPAIALLLCIAAPWCPVAVAAVPPTYVLQWQAGGFDPLDLTRYGPSSIAWSPDGFVYVVDRYVGRMNTFSPEGVLLRTWYCDRNGEQVRPTRVAVGPNRTVFVAGVCGDSVCVQEYTPTGTLIQGWSVTPYPCSLSGMAVSLDGTVFLTDEDLSQVVAFDRAGTFLRRWGTPGTGPGQLPYPTGVAVSPSGTVYVSDPFVNRITAFASDSTYLFSWGSTGNGDRQFLCVAGPAVDTDGKVYACDRGLGRVQVFSPTGEFITSVSTRDAGVAPWEVALDGTSRLFVLDSNGGLAARYDYQPTPVQRPSWGRLKSAYR